MDNPGKTEAVLNSYRVLDLTDEKGLMCGQLLGSLGADVIKIERPGGDPARNIGPFFHDTPDPEKSLFWFAFNTNKRGITLNLETVEGQEIMRQMVKGADVVIESFTPGYLGEMGLGYPALEKTNPRIIMTSITPFGQTGPCKDDKVSDLVCWAMGGALFTCGSSGRPPVCVSHVPQAFLQGSADGAWGTAMALYWRGISGEGQHVDISIIESVERCALGSHVTWKLTGASFDQCGSRFAVFPNRPDMPPNTWETKDGYVTYVLYTGEQGARMNLPLIKWMSEEGQADEYLTTLDWNKFEWPDFSMEEKERIARYYATFFKTKTNAELFEGAKQRNAVIEPVHTIKDVLGHPQLEARAYWQELEHAELGTRVIYPGGFCRLSDTFCKQWRRAPLIGEHNMEIYQSEMGFSEERLNHFKQAGII